MIVYNDHVNQFFFDAYPTFALGVGAVHAQADEGWGKRPLPDLPGDPDFAWHLARSLVVRRVRPDDLPGNGTRSRRAVVSSAADGQQLESSGRSSGSECHPAPDPDGAAVVPVGGGATAGDRVFPDRPACCRVRHRRADASAARRRAMGGTTRRGTTNSWTGWRPIRPAVRVVDPGIHGARRHRGCRDDHVAGDARRARRERHGGCIGTIPRR